MASRNTVLHKSTEKQKSGSTKKYLILQNVRNVLYNLQQE